MRIISSRNPRPGNYIGIGADPEGLHFDFRNNVTYNWEGSVSGYNDDDTGFVSRYNFIGNDFIKGPESASGSYVFRESSIDANGYFADNAKDDVVPTGLSGQWVLVYFNPVYFISTDLINRYKASSLVPMEPVTTTSAAQAKIDVLADAGASYPRRDIIDTRIVKDVLNKTGHSIWDTNAQPEGGWPALNSLPALQTATMMECRICGKRRRRTASIQMMPATVTGTISTLTTQIWKYISTGWCLRSGRTLFMMV